MLLEAGQSLDVNQQAKPRFLGTSRKVALPPFHEMFSPQTLTFLICLSPTPGALTHRVWGGAGHQYIDPKLAGDAGRLQA